MKIIFPNAAYLIILASLVFFSTKVYSQKDFSKLTTSTDSTFGYTNLNPLKLRKGNQRKSIANSREFLSGLKTHDNQNLTLLIRSSAKDPAFKEPAIRIYDRQTKMPINGKLGILDKYVFLTSNTKDTITLYVDIYNKADLYVPVGLKYEQPID